LRKIISSSKNSK